VKTPDAPAAAREALVRLGPITRSERLMAGISLVLLTFWILGSAIGLDVTAAALIAVAALLLTGVIGWEDACREQEAWNTFVWFATVVMMATYLGQGR
jgi:DASS family divalent anion:Na+ symporter